MKNKVDITFILGVFTSAVLVWIYLYNTIIDLTTSEPAALSLLYLGISHYCSFLSVLFSFILLLRYCFEISLDSFEINKLSKFQNLANFSQRALFSVWGPMFIFCITALLSQNMFSGSNLKFLQENGGFIVGLFLCITFFHLILRINILKLFSKDSWVHLLLTPFYFLIYTTLLSIYSADIKCKVEKDFYQKNEIARFEVKRKGYIFLPYVKNVTYNFHISLEENSNNIYYVDLSKDSTTKQSLIEITYTPQIFEFPMRKYIYINKTDK